MSDDDSILFEVNNYVALITLNRAPVNALNRASRMRMTRIFDEINDRDDVRVAVLTGSGNVFCAGADLKDRPNLDVAGEYSNHNRIIRETGNSMRECSKPIIAAINGPAIGAGVGMAAACDIMLASNNAYFAMTEINVGLAGGGALLNELFGRSRMRRMMYTGMKVSASELYRLGVIEMAVEPDCLLAEAMKIAEEIANKNPAGIRAAKTSANMVGVMPPRDAYRMEQNFTVELAKTDDAKEAKQAFFEKRKPVFTGK